MYIVIGQLYRFKATASVAAFQELILLYKNHPRTSDLLTGASTNYIKRHLSLTLKIPRTERTGEIMYLTQQQLNML